MIGLVLEKSGTRFSPEHFFGREFQATAVSTPSYTFQPYEVAPRVRIEDIALSGVPSIPGKWDYSWKPVDASLPEMMIQVKYGGTWELQEALWQDSPYAAKPPKRQSLRDLQIEQFLEEVYLLAALNLESATDRVYDCIDRLLCDGEEEVVDQILAKANVNRLPTALMRSFLTVTAPAKRKLKCRAALYREIEKAMQQTKGQETTKKLIGRLF